MDPTSATNMMQHSVITWLSSNLRTDSWLVDMMLVMALSGAISAVIAWYHSGRDLAASGITSLLVRILRYFGVVNEPYTLIVQYNTSVNKYGDECAFDCESDNQHLLSAVFLYAENQGELAEANVSMIQGTYDYKNQYDMMKKKLLTLKPINSAIQIDDDITVVVSVVVEGSTEKAGGSTRSSATIQSRTSFEACEAFAKKAYDFYVEQEFRRFEDEEEDQKLKYYSIRNIDHETGNITWNQFYLGTARSFNYLYFDEKEATLKLIDNFVSRSAQFAIGGPTYKLGFLLYGVPGCGKTSFIKALANYTNRHIIDMHLSKFAKNSEVRDAFFQKALTYHHSGSTDTVEVPLDKRIIIMEDIDALSDLVSRRSETDTWNEKDFKKLKKKGDAGEQEKEKKQDEEKEEKTAIEKYIEKHERLEDRLNLASLLSVMDGTLELTGPIIIMTTNLPETLDPALIRSGRITKHIYFGKMSLHSIVQMLRFYFHDEILDGGVSLEDADDDLELTTSMGEDAVRSSGATIDFSVPIDWTKDVVQTTAAFRERYMPLYALIPDFEQLHRKIAPNDLEAICRNSINLEDCCVALNEFLSNL